MKKIALISDTHGPLPEDVIPYIHDADELWHAGDLGSRFLDAAVLEKITFRAVYGNIDDRSIRYQCPLDLEFECEGVRVFMTHIGGYPGRYTARVRKLLDEFQPQLYICGHSHICKIMKDNNRKLIHMNPGACGQTGFHRIRTMILFELDQGKIQNVRVVELGPRGKISAKG